MQLLYAFFYFVQKGLLKLWCFCYSLGVGVDLIDQLIEHIQSCHLRWVVMLSHHFLTNKAIIGISLGLYSLLRCHISLSALLSHWAVVKDSISPLSLLTPLRLYWISNSHDGLLLRKARLYLWLGVFLAGYIRLFLDEDVLVFLWIHPLNYLISFWKNRGTLSHWFFVFLWIFLRGKNIFRFRNLHIVWFLFLLREMQRFDWFWHFWGSIYFSIRNLRQSNFDNFTFVFRIGVISNRVNFLQVYLFPLLITFIRLLYFYWFLFSQ